MTTPRGPRYAATFALLSAAVLTPLVGTTTSAAAVGAAAPASLASGCSAEEQAFQDAAAARDTDAAELSAYVLGAYGDARDARRAAATARDEAKQAKADAEAAVQAAEDAEALAAARAQLAAAKAQLAQARATYQQATVTFNDATATRKALAADRNTTKAAAGVARAALEACQATPGVNVTVTDVYDAGGVQMGTITFAGLTSGDAFFSASIDWCLATDRVAGVNCFAWPYDAGVDANGTVTVGPTQLMWCGPGSAESALFRNYDASLYAQATGTWTPVC